MNTKFIAGILFSLAAALSGNAFAKASAIAVDGENKAAWATADSAKEAEKTAMQMCTEASKTNDCKIVRMVAFAIAEGKRHIGFWPSERSLADAKSVALKSCAAADCEITFETTNPGFFALAWKKNQDGSVASQHVTHSYGNYDKAVKDAIEKCEVIGTGKCEFVRGGVIAGNHNLDTSNPVASTKKTAPSCRPKTNPINCKSHCVNDSCVVEYDNGCKMNVRVTPQTDPFTGKIKFPTPAC